MRELRGWCWKCWRRWVEFTTGDGDPDCPYCPSRRVRLREVSP